jgi:hypothetical protein
VVVGVDVVVPGADVVVAGGDVVVVGVATALVVVVVTLVVGADAGRPPQAVSAATAIRAAARIPVVLRSMMATSRHL